LIATAARVAEDASVGFPVNEYLAPNWKLVFARVWKTEDISVRPAGVGLPQSKSHWNKFSPANDGFLFGRH